MLNRTALPLRPPLGGSISWPRGQADGPIAQTAKESIPLLRFLLVLILLCGLTCLYLWQTSTVTKIQQETGRLNLENFEYERGNVELMQQVATWYGPGYICEEARARGMQLSTNPIYSITPQHSR